MSNTKGTRTAKSLSQEQMVAAMKRAREELPEGTGLVVMAATFRPHGGAKANFITNLGRKAAAKLLSLMADRLEREDGTEG